jgi:hypothetical protein
MHIMTLNKYCAYPMISALLTMATVWSLGLAAAVPARAGFWVRDQPGRITHACTGTEPLVMCLQGRKVVMQVQSDRTERFLLHRPVLQRAERGREGEGSVRGGARVEPGCARQ